jgi:hypothetical protein
MGAHFAQFIASAKSAELRLMDREFIIVVGNQGFGKSVWAKIYTQRNERLFVSDPLCSYGANFDIPPSDWVEPILSGKAQRFRIGTPAYPDELPIMGNAAYAVGNCTFVIEECALLFPRGAPIPEWMQPLVFMGRAQRVNLLLVAQRMAKIPVDLRSQATRIVSFRQTESDDVDALIDRIGDEAEEVTRLPELECLDWNMGDLKRYSISTTGLPAKREPDSPGQPDTPPLDIQDPSGNIEEAVPPET